MKYVKITTDDEETRWINLAQVCRVTLAKDVARNHPVMAIIFADGNVEDKLVITGTDKVNRKAIDVLTASLNELTGG